MRHYYRLQSLLYFFYCLKTLENYGESFVSHILFLKLLLTLVYAVHTRDVLSIYQNNLKDTSRSSEPRDDIFRTDPYKEKQVK